MKVGHRVFNSELPEQLRNVWRLSLPAILTQITSIVMQYIDSAMVGRLGANASAAIGLVTTSTWLLSGMIYAVSAGFSVQVAHHIGGKQEKKARLIVKHGLLTAFVVSVTLMLIGLLVSSNLPRWLGGAEYLHRDASRYFLVFALMLPFMQLNTLTSSFLQCSGDMVTPSALNAFMCLLDVVFNAIFIPMYGVLGAAIGTGLAYVAISLIMMWFCCIRNEALRINRKETWTFDGSILTRALKIGAPVGIQEIAMSTAMVLMTTVIAPLGATAIAANSFAVTAESLCYMPGYGISSAATTLIGRNIGAREYRLAKRYANICVIFGASFMALTGGIMYVACPIVFQLLTPDETVRSLATEVLRIGLLAEPLFGVAIVASGVTRGAGDTLIPSIFNLISIWIVRLGLAVLLVGRFGLHGVWTAMAIELCVRGLLQLYRQQTSKFYHTTI